MHNFNIKLLTHLKNVTEKNLKISKYKISLKSLFFFNFFLKNFLIKGFYKLNKKQLIFFPNYKMLYLIKKIKLQSKPSNKKYTKFLELKNLIKKNNEFGLISTSQKGIITFSEALKLKIGGEIVFYLKSILK